jgi:hypothetical protein
MDARPKSAMITPHKVTSLLVTPKADISRNDPVTANTTFDASKFVNADYLAPAEHKDKCIGCSQCMKPQHRIVSYRYPKQLKTKYGEIFNISRPDPD